jgi:hypothetical protein
MGERDAHYPNYQGDQIGQIFPIGLLLEALYMVFWKDEVAQRNSDILGLFFDY